MSWTICSARQRSVWTRVLSYCFEQLDCELTQIAFHVEIAFMQAFHALKRPCIGDCFSFLCSMRHPTKYLTPYFWNAAEEHEVISNSFYSNEAFFMQVADELLASKFTDASDKLAIQQVS